MTADLEEPLIQQAVNWLDQSANHEVFYLVPRHIEFEKEIDVLKKIRQMNRDTMIASTRLQIFNFDRLAWYYLRDTSYYSSKLLSEAGAAMLFRQVLLENEQELQIFQGEITKEGFIQQLFDFYQEIQDGNITIDELDTFLTQLDKGAKEQELQIKLKDLALIFTKFEEKAKNYQFDTKKIVENLTKYLTNQNLSHVSFLISGFHQFTAKELELICLLIKKAGEVKISLPLDRSYTNSLPEPMDIFAETGTLYYQFYQFARTNRVPLFTDYVVNESSLIPTTGICQLENYWIAAQKQYFPKMQQQILDNCVQIWKGENVKEEILSVACEIRRLVAEEGYRYKDIQLITRDMACYENLLKPLLALYDIPIYLDHDQTMEQHPLVEWIQSFFAIYNYNYRYRDILRFLRTELFFPKENQKWETIEQWQAACREWRNKVDITENVVLAYGYEGTYWSRKQDWSFIQYDFEEHKLENTKQIEEDSNEIRQQVQKYLPVCFKKLKKAKNGLEAAKIFHHFLIESGVKYQINQWRIQAIEAGNLEEAKNHEQVWTALMTLLDEYVEIYKNEPFFFETFQEIFTSGLAGINYSRIPATIDQVQVRLIDLTRAAAAKVIFAIGLTEEAFPKKIENKTLLSDEERQLTDLYLADDQFLANSTEKKIAQEPFIAYKMLVSATEKLYLTYHCTKDTKQEIKCSPYIRNIQQAFMLPIIEKREGLPTDDEAISLTHIGTYPALIGELTRLKRQNQEIGEPVSGFWLAMEKALTRQPEISQTASFVFSSLGYTNNPENLTETFAEALYGKHIYTSISQMEAFHHCQFQYFLQFGLNLKERLLFQLTSAATGEFFHEALDQFFKLLIRQNKYLPDLTDEEVANFSDNVLTAVLDEPKFSILTSSNRMNYLRYQLSQTIKKVSWALKKQSQKSGFSTVQTEILFGQLAIQQGIPGLELALEKQGKISVRGKIDRVDQLITNDREVYLGVIDYKSSHRKFNITEVYYGLAMQMLTYLDVALMDAVQLVGKTAKPAGSFYLHVHNPTLSYDTTGAIEQKLLKKYQYDGLLINDSELLNYLDKELEEKTSSTIFPIEASAKGIIKPGRKQENKFVTEMELQSLLKNNREKIKKAGNKIINGEIQMNPAYQGKERIACRFCQFKSICTFDTMLKENNYHKIATLSKKEVMERLSKEGIECIDDGKKDSITTTK